MHKHFISRQRAAALAGIFLWKVKSGSAWPVEVKGITYNLNHDGSSYYLTTFN